MVSHAPHDLEDERLLDVGAYDELLARHYPAIVERLRLRLPDGEALDVAHEAIQRLLEELRRGRRYRVPFRVVAHMVVSWKLKEHFGGPATFPLDGFDDERPAPDDLEGLVARLDVARRLATLPDGERRALTLRYIDGLPIDEIAARLDMTRNAVDQALYRGHRRLRRDWDD